MKKYKFIDHTADLGIEITGSSKKELFEAGVEGMMDIICERKKLKENYYIELDIEGETDEELLFNLLKKVMDMIYLDSFLCKRCKIIDKRENKLKALCYGEKFKDEYIPEDKIKKEIKAITYHNLEIKKSDNKYKTVIIFDV